jgi:hypothetical protein
MVSVRQEFYKPWHHLSLAPGRHVLVIKPGLQSKQCNMRAGCETVRGMLGSTKARPPWVLHSGKTSASSNQRCLALHNGCSHTRQSLQPLSASAESWQAMQLHAL